MYIKGHGELIMTYHVMSEYQDINPLVTNGLSHPVTNGLSHPYHLNESTFIFRGIRSDFSFLFHFSMKFVSANRIAPDGTPRFAASQMGCGILRRHI